MSTGPLPAGITDDLEALKRHLVAMSAHDMTPEETRVLAAEISAIRLQLKRLAADQARPPAA